MPTPITSDPYDLLLSHNLWATRQLLKLSARLTPEQFVRPFPIGPAEKGGLHAILAHVIGAMGRWSDRISGRPPRPPLAPAWTGYSGPVDERGRTPAELDEILQISHNDLVALAPSIRKDPARIVRLEFGGVPYSFTASCAFVHVLTHGHYHHAQCINILRQLNLPGISDQLPELDMTDWQSEADMRE
ncbi:MAG: DinB family protein [Phycisphaerales bacterium]|nr:DinB family protein [Planctomycetota bacterium]